MLPFDDDFDHDSRLNRAAQPVLDRLADSLSDTNHSILLANPEGKIIRRWVGMRSLNRRLDSASIAPGFDFAEEFAGTNGVGTALEEAKLVGVHGDEHFSHWLQNFSCVGLPVKHPVRGTVEGVIDFTCLTDDFSALIPPLLIEAAEHIQTLFAQEASHAETALFDHYLRATRTTRGAVVAIRPNVFLTNAAATKILGPMDQAVLWEAACELMRLGRSSGEVTLSGGTYDALITAVDGPARTTPGVVIRLAPRGRMGTPGSPDVPEPRTPAIPSGRSAAWRHMTNQLPGIVAAGGSVVFVGESGVGKQVVAQHLHQQRAGVHVLHTRNATDIERDARFTSVIERLAAGDTVILRRIELLSDDGLDKLGDLARRDTRGRLIATCTEEAEPQLQRALGAFSHAVRLPPLRQRTEDIADLVQVILRELGSSATGCELPALQMLMRYPWPGNTAELRDVLRNAARNAGNGVIGVIHLPAWVISQGHGRQFSAMEQAEYDVIVKTLAATSSRTEAAKVLGIGRATLYRRLRALGISSGELVK